MTHDPLEFFNRHRTIRKYKPVPLRDGDLARIVAAAQRAPTDATAQMYSFVRLEDPILKNEIATLSNNAHIASASESFVVLADVYRLQRLLELRGHAFGDWPAVAVHFAIGDAVLAGQNMLLAAEMLGYSGCWIGGVLGALDEIVARLGLPKGVLPFAGLTVGVADEEPAQRPRIQPELVLHTNRYREPDATELEEALARMAPITARGDWAATLARYFAKGGGMESREPVLRRVMQTQGFGHVVPENNLNALVQQANAAGFPEVLVRAKDGRFEAWVDRPDRAERGEGQTPLEALAAAVAAAVLEGQTHKPD